MPELDVKVTELSAGDAINLFDVVRLVTHTQPASMNMTLIVCADGHVQSFVNDHVVRLATAEEVANARTRSVRAQFLLLLGTLAHTISEHELPCATYADMRIVVDTVDELRRWARVTDNRIRDHGGHIPAIESTWSDGDVSIYVGVQSSERFPDATEAQSEEYEEHCVAVEIKPTTVGLNEWLANRPAQ